MNRWEPIGGIGFLVHNHSASLLKATPEGPVNAFPQAIHGLP